MAYSETTHQTAYNRRDKGNGWRVREVLVIAYHTIS